MGSLTSDEQTTEADIRREAELQGVDFPRRDRECLARVLCAENVELGDIAIMAAVKGYAVAKRLYR